MSNTTDTGPGAHDGSEWNQAWDVVARLAAARQGLTITDDAPDEAAGATAAEAGTNSTAAVALAAVAPDQLARDMAEIERAAAALRDQEPSLELRRTEAAEVEAETARDLQSAPRSVWTLVAGIWIFAALIVCGALGAIALIIS
jgi:hypothetical protein